MSHFWTSRAPHSTATDDLLPTKQFSKHSSVYGSKNQNDSNFKLALTRICRNKWATFRSASTDLDHALVVCVIKICRSGSKCRSFCRQTRFRASLKLLSLISSFIRIFAEPEPTLPTLKLNSHIETWIPTMKLEPLIPMLTLTRITRPYIYLSSCTTSQTHPSPICWSDVWRRLLFDHCGRCRGLEGGRRHCTAVEWGLDTAGGTVPVGSPPNCSFCRRPAFLRPANTTVENISVILIYYQM